MNQDDREAIRELLMGRRVVAVETFDPREIDGTYLMVTGKMTLDDGREVYVAPNQGGCACSAGDYWLKSLERVDNIITRVDLQTEATKDEDGWDGNTTYRIFVFADNVQINLLTVEGDDGNGYYGTGYELVVVPVKEDGQ